MQIPFVTKRPFSTLQNEKIDKIRLNLFIWLWCLNFKKYPFQSIDGYAIVLIEIMVLVQLIAWSFFTTIFNNADSLIVSSFNL